MLDLNAIFVISYFNKLSIFEKTSYFIHVLIIPQWHIEL